MLALFVVWKFEIILFVSYWWAMINILRIKTGFELQTIRGWAPWAYPARTAASMFNVSLKIDGGTLGSCHIHIHNTPLKAFLWQAYWGIIQITMNLTQLQAISSVFTNFRHNLGEFGPF